MNPAIHLSKIFPGTVHGTADHSATLGMTRETVALPFGVAFAPGYSLPVPRIAPVRWDPVRKPG
jgi:hypothetical protein